jgi:hypothetical protein
MTTKTTVRPNAGGRRTVSAKGPTDKAAAIQTAQRAPDSADPPAASDSERQSRIAELAYLKAERRGFAPGYELEDWLEAELELDSLASI